MITKEFLEKIQPGIFAYGLIASDKYDHLVNWVAVRGTIPDWAVYIKPDAEYEMVKHIATPDRFREQVRYAGTKVHDMEHVRKMIEYDLEAGKMYRH